MSYIYSIILTSISFIFFILFLGFLFYFLLFIILSSFKLHHFFLFSISLSFPFPFLHLHPKPPLHNPRHLLPIRMPLLLLPRHHHLIPNQPFQKLHLRHRIHLHHPLILIEMFTPTNIHIHLLPRPPLHHQQINLIPFIIHPLLHTQPFHLLKQFTYFLFVDRTSFVGFGEREGVFREDGGATGEVLEFLEEHELAFIEAVLEMGVEEGGGFGHGGADGFGDADEFEEAEVVPRGFFGLVGEFLLVHIIKSSEPALVLWIHTDQTHQHMHQFIQMDIIQPLPFLHHLIEHLHILRVLLQINKPVGFKIQVTNINKILVFHEFVVVFGEDGDHIVIVLEFDKMEEFGELGEGVGDGLEEGEGRRGVERVEGDAGVVVEALGGVGDGLLLEDLALGLETEGGGDGGEEGGDLGVGGRGSGEGGKGFVGFDEFEEVERGAVEEGAVLEEFEGVEFSPGEGIQMFNTLPLYCHRHSATQRHWLPSPPFQPSRQPLHHHLHLPPRQPPHPLFHNLPHSFPQLHHLPQHLPLLKPCQQPTQHHNLTIRQLIPLQVLHKLLNQFYIRGGFDEEHDGDSFE